MDEMLYDVSLSESGKLLVTKANNNSWSNQIYWGSNGNESVIGTYCKESQIQQTKKKLVNRQIKNAEKELIKWNKKLNMLKKISIE